MNQNFNNIDDAFFWIESFTNLEKDAKEKKRHYRPERMLEILEQFGNPHLSCRVIHSAGSKGKGSTSALLAAALAQNGWKTGLYTSPHVLHYKERIQIDSSPLADHLYIACINSIKDKLDMQLPGGTEPTTFEILTVLAFLLFKEEKCDFCVIETGLGGRLDATNAVQPEASVLTPVELEHQEWLGETLREIAGEKAGIIKKNTPVFSAPQKKEVESVFRQKAAEMNAPFYCLDQEVQTIESAISTKGTSYSIQYKDGRRTTGHLALLGHIQAWNAALALKLLTTLYPEVNEEVWLKGFEKASLPGRMELLREKPLIILDGSHTPGSVSLAVKSFQSLSGINNDSEKILLFACQDDKDALEMARILSPEFSKIVITTPGFFKKSSPQNVYLSFSSFRKDCILEEDPGKALKLVLSEKKDVLIMGSFILAGAIKKIYGVNE